jgi:hypothetical protein
MLTDQFISSFLTAYKQAASLFQSPAWDDVWRQHWSRFMLWNPPPPPQQRPVLGMTADGMGLTYWEHEPFRVDAAFVRPNFSVIGNLPLPLVVAIEHENNLRTFKQEIATLSQVRCPLKVGITYCMLTPAARDPDLDVLQLKIKKWIRDITDQLEIGEAPETEYLYLIGLESQGLNLDWYAYYYTAEQGCSAGTWKRVAAMKGGSPTDYNRA